MKIWVKQNFTARWRFFWNECEIITLLQRICM